MAAHTERPIIFPLSNPTKLAEAKAEDLIKWTDGRALVATGIPADDVDYKGVTYQIGQGNNALMYPGLGFGLIALADTSLYPISLICFVRQFTFADVYPVLSTPTLLCNVDIMSPDLDC